jgi:hypothetical protein
MKWECAPSRWTRDEWVVEAIDHESEGEIYAALFSGPGAQARAEEYATWKTWRDLAEPVCEGDDDEEEEADGLIAGRRVISKPGAAVEVTELILTPKAQRDLTIAATSLGKVR